MGVDRVTAKENRWKFKPRLGGVIYKPWGGSSPFFSSVGAKREVCTAGLRNGKALCWNSFFIS